MVLLRPELRVDSSYCPLCTSTGRRGGSWTRCECGVRVHHACVLEFSVTACPTPGCRAWSRAIRGSWSAVSGAGSTPVVPGWFVLAGPAVGLWLVGGLVLRPGPLEQQPLLAQALLLGGPLLIWVLLALYLVASMLLAAAWQALTAGYRRANDEQEPVSPPPVSLELDGAELPRRASTRARPRPRAANPPASTEAPQQVICQEVDAEAERLLAEAGRTWYARGVRAYAEGAVRIQFDCRCCHEQRFAWVEEHELDRVGLDPAAAEHLLRGAVRTLVDPADGCDEGSVQRVAKRLIARARARRPRRPWGAPSRQRTHKRTSSPSAHTQPYAVKLG